MYQAEPEEYGENTGCIQMESGNERGRDRYCMAGVRTSAEKDPVCGKTRDKRETINRTEGVKANNMQIVLLRQQVRSKRERSCIEV